MSQVLLPLDVCIRATCIAELSRCADEFPEWRETFRDAVAGLQALPTWDEPTTEVVSDPGADAGAALHDATELLVGLFGSGPKVSGV